MASGRTFFKSIYAHRSEINKHGTTSITYPYVDSTMAEARRFVKQSPDDWPGFSRGIVFVSKEQSAGIGQENRRWVSKPGGLYYTLLIASKDIDESEADNAKKVGLRLMGVIGALSRLPVDMKLPNDMLVRGRKIGGILIQSLHHAGRTLKSIGIGLNLNQSTFPPDLRTDASSIALETGHHQPEDLYVSHITSQLQDLFQPNG